MLLLPGAGLALARCCPLGDGGGWWWRSPRPSGSSLTPRIPPCCSQRACHQRPPPSPNCCWGPFHTKWRRRCEEVEGAARSGSGSTRAVLPIRHSSSTGRKDRLLPAGRPAGPLPRPLVSVPVLGACSCRRGEQHRAAHPLCPCPPRPGRQASRGLVGDSPRRGSAPFPGSAVWTPCGSREGRVTISGRLPGAR